GQDLEFSYIGIVNLVLPYEMSMTKVWSPARLHRSRPYRNGRERCSRAGIPLKNPSVTARADNKYLHMKIINVFTLLAMGLLCQINMAQETQVPAALIVNTEQMEQERILAEAKEAKEVQKRIEKAEREARK